MPDETPPGIRGRTALGAIYDDAAFVELPSVTSEVIPWVPDPEWGSIQSYIAGPVTFVGDIQPRVDLPVETRPAAGNPLETFSPADFRNHLEEYRLALGVPSTPGLSTREEDWEEYRNAFRSDQEFTVLSQNTSYSAIANAMVTPLRTTRERVNAPPLEYLASLPLEPIPTKPSTPRVHKYDFEFDLP